MTTDFPLNPNALSGLQKLQVRINAWCSEHQVAIGVGEMAVGASLIALGVSTGAIELGNALVATSTPLINPEALMGSITGLAAGSWVGYLLGAVGVAAGGTAFGIPAVLVIAGAAAIFSLAGYAAGDIVHNMITPSLNLGHLVASGSALAVGTYLLIRGGRRLLRSFGECSALKLNLPDTRHGKLYLQPLATAIIARTKQELAGFTAVLTTSPASPSEVAALSGGAVSLGALGGIAGGAVAAGSVTVMGSPMLGCLALSMGVVSAPLWPVVAGVLAGGSLGFGLVKALKHWGCRKNK
jgi:hypothetical protein